MPDNHLDDQYIDKAWEQMRQLLDQEMPVQEKRRRGAFWWWLLPLLLLFAGGAGWWLLERSSEPKPATDEMQLDTITERPVANTNPKQPESTAPENSIAHAKTTTTSAAQKRQTATISGKGKPDLIRENEGENTFITSAIAPEKMPVVNDSQIIEDKSTSSFKPDEERIIAEAPSQQSKPPFTVQNLDSRAFQLLPLPEMGLETAPNTANHRGLFRWGLEGGVASRNLPAPDGAFGGVIAEFPLLGRQLHLRTGLQYGANRLVIDTPSDNFRSEAANDPQSGGSRDNAAIGRINFDLLGQQIALPVALVFQPGPKWGVEAGASLSYLTQARGLAGNDALVTFDNDNTSFNPDLSPANRFVNNLYADSNQAINLAELNRWNFAATVGVVHYPADRWGVRLHYQHSFTDVLKNTDYQSFNRGVRLSALYYFR